MRLLLAFVFFVGCKGEPAPVAPPPVVVADAAPKQPVTIDEKPAQTDVRFDRRVELISIVYKLAGAKEYNTSKATAQYIAAVEAHFPAKLWAKHDAVQHAISLRNKYGIGFDAPMSLAIHLDDKLEPRPGADAAMTAMDHRWKGVDVAAFATKLRDFATASKFDEFYAAQEPFYKAAADQLRAIVDKENPVGWFDAMFGAREKSRYVVVPSVIAGTSNFGPRTTLPDGTLESYQILGLSTDDGMPVDDASTVSLLVHEMAHSYINPVFDAHRAKLQPAGQQLFQLVALQMRRQAYPTWEIMVNESGVRAVTALYLKERKGDVAGANAARDEVRRGFVWTHELIEQFRKYKRDRATYPDLAAFMPAIVDFFDGVAKKYNGKLPPMPFMGPFDAVFDGAPIVVAAPVPADDKDKLAKYVAEIHPQIFATRGPLEVASDSTLTKFPNRHVVAYGTPESNAVIADIAQRASWKIDTRGITLGKKFYPGPTLILVAVWFRHDDPTKGVAVYAASNHNLLPGINSLRHGSNDWMIAKPDGKGNHVVIASGDWPSFNGGWVAPE